MKQLLIFAAILASAMPAFADRDFLTNDEIDKVRDAQEPNDRLKLYVLFARQRVDQLQRLLEKEKKGRSLMARELLEDYASIIDAMDTVSDDALKHGTDIAIGAAAVRDAEKRMLEQLQKIEDRGPSDLEMYSVSLTDAIEATKDSLDLSSENPEARAAKLNADDKKTKQEAEAVLKSEQSKDTDKTPGQARANGDVSASQDQSKRKPPTLYRPGEKPDPDTQ